MTTDTHESDEQFDPNIPPEALQAVAKSIHAEWHRLGYEPHDWDMLDPEEVAEYCTIARAACIAMLKNWPGMGVSSPGPWSAPDTIILPIPPEALEAAETAYADAGGFFGGYSAMEAACLAMLRAWPGAFPYSMGQPQIVLPLPLPTEKTDDK